MARLTLVIGIVASGKSYFIKNALEKENCVCLDIMDYQNDIEREVGQLLFSEYRTTCLEQANVRMISDIVSCLEEGRDVIAEQTLYKAKRRIKFVEEIKRRTDAHISVYVILPGKENWTKYIAERGLDDKIMDLSSEFEFPILAEGYDEIFEAIDGNIRIKKDTSNQNLNEDIGSGQEREGLQEIESYEEVLKIRDYMSRTSEEKKIFRLHEDMNGMFSKLLERKDDISFRVKCLTEIYKYTLGHQYPDQEIMSIMQRILDDASKLDDESLKAIDYAFAYKIAEYNGYDLSKVPVVSASKTMDLYTSAKYEEMVELSNKYPEGSKMRDMILKESEGLEPDKKLLELYNVLIERYTFRGWV